MAVRKIYALLDTKVQEFLNPLVFVNDMEALRWFETAVNQTNGQSNVDLYPEQFILYRLQDFDSSLGKFLETIDEKAVKGPKELAIGITLVNDEKKTATKQLELFKELLDKMKEL